MICTARGAGIPDFKAEPKEEKRETTKGGTFYRQIKNRLSLHRHPVTLTPAAGSGNPGDNDAAAAFPVRRSHPRCNQYHSCMQQTPPPPSGAAAAMNRTQASQEKKNRRAGKKSSIRKNAVPCCLSAHPAAADYQISLIPLHATFIRRKCE